MASIQSKKTKAGVKIYYVVASVKGCHKWIKAGTQADAKVLKKKIEALNATERLEKLGISSRDKRIDEFFQEYLDHVRLRTSPNSHKRYRAALNAFIAFLRIFHSNLKVLKQITPDTIEDFQQKRLESFELKTLSDGEKPGNHLHKKLPLPQTVNYEVSVIRSALIWAQDRGLISLVPTRKVKPLRAKPTRQARVLTLEECKLLLKTAKEVAKTDKSMRVYHDAFQFLLNTGLRSGELCNLTWDDVCLKIGLIKIRPKEGWTPKSYSREFFLNGKSVKLLGGFGNKEGYVFKTASGKQLEPDRLRVVLIKVAKRAGIKGLTRVHDLRHTFNSLMQMNGVDPATMGKILGHKDIETTMIYTHQTQEHLRKSIEKVGV
ncbi:MAG: tyrosine-type recombinase/integrase [bacterium]